MQTPKAAQQKKTKEYDKNSQKGAFVSVMFVGGFIASLYVVIYAIYMARF